MPLGRYAIISCNSTPYVFVSGGRPYVDAYCTPVDLLFGDATGDRMVDTRDFNRLAGAFGTTFPATAESSGDFNLDRAVNSVDFGIYLSCYGTKLSSDPPFPPASPVDSPFSTGPALTASGGFFDDSRIGFFQ
jgi:hypothetical protein